MFLHEVCESVAVITLMIPDFCFGLGVPEQCFLAKSTL